MSVRKTSSNPGFVARIDVGRLLPKVIKRDITITRSMSSARRSVDQLRKVLDTLFSTLRELESQDKLGNFEIQDLMSQYNQVEQLASNIQKKRDDTATALIGKI